MIKCVAERGAEGKGPGQNYGAPKMKKRTSMRIKIHSKEKYSRSELDRVWCGRKRHLVSDVSMIWDILGGRNSKVWAVGGVDLGVEQR